MYSPWQTAPRASRTIQWVIILGNVIRGNDGAFIVARARRIAATMRRRRRLSQRAMPNVVAKRTCCTAVHVRRSRAICTRDSAMTHVRASPSSCRARDTRVLRTDFDFWSLPELPGQVLDARDFVDRSTQYIFSFLEIKFSILPDEIGVEASRRASYQTISYIKRIMENVIIRLCL